MMHPLECAMRIVHAGVGIAAFIFAMKILSYALRHPFPL